MHFSFLPFWLMKSRPWLGGTVCFKHRLTRHSVFTSDTIHCGRCSRSAPAPHPLLHCNFLDLYSFSCTVIECIVSLCSGLLWCDAKKNEITYRVFFVFFWVFKATKINRREQGVFRGRLHFDTEQRRCIHCLQLVLVAHTCIQSHLFRAYYLYGYWYLTFILRCWVGEQHRKHWKVM